uniref:60S ribosomal protein L7 n=1 Tax=Piliocolobus tephrosceles TaxID=591936 RepID=A0A8C9LJJ7_9PRIM
MSEMKTKLKERTKEQYEKMKKMKEVEKKIRKNHRNELCKRTIKYYKEYEAEINKIAHLKRLARKNGCYYREAGKKVVFVIRLKGVNKLSPKVRSIFRLFRLLQVHNGVFVKVNKATKTMLKLIEPFITYGYPNRSTIQKLLYKRGYIKVGKSRRHCRKKIQNNEDISDHLGLYGIHGVEDMVYQIHTCGPYFKKVNKFLWTFKLKPPKKGFKAKRHGFNEQRPGDWGNRENHINELIERMI